MAVATEKVSTNGKATHNALRPAGPARSPVARRRQVPWVVAGVVLVVGCALAFALASLRLSGGEEVLAVAQPVAAGQVLAASDLRVVRVSPAAGLQPVLAGSEAAIVGRPVSVSLVPGTLLTPADLGSAPPGPAGADVVALALKAGAFPPSVAAGDSVAVIPVANSASAGTTPLTASASPVSAVVVGVQPAPQGSSADEVVSLSVDPADAATVARLGAAGQAVLVQLPAGSSSPGAGQ
ncbi:MAG TPA: SAF domain-containing protein [Acidimicrobiales bacterium]|nr:SAF domain-containing protein [Acidimicrobiales bacterium]